MRHATEGPSPPAAARWVVVGAVAAWLLLSASALVAGDPGGVATSGGVLLAVVAAVQGARSGAVRRVGAFSVGLYAVGLAAATLYVGITAPGAGEAARVQVLTGNPNVLGAALVTAMAAWAAVAPRRRWVWWLWPVVALAVVYTGSRTSAGALLAAGTVWLVLHLLRVRRRALLVPLLLLAVVGVAAFAWQRGVVERTPNLLAAPSDLTDPAWRIHGERVDIAPDAIAGPFEGTRAQRLVAEAQEGRRLLILQSIGSSEVGVPYVASVYLRADEPQQVILTSHLARTTCEVGTAWARCITPVGYGDAIAQRQIHLQAPERGGAVDVYVFGAQYERGTEATPFIDARPDWIPQSMVNRYDLRRITFLPASRVIAWRAGLEIASDHPWFGVGQIESADAFRELTGPDVSTPIGYAHNLLIEALAVRGIVGAFGAALFVAALLVGVSGAGWARLAPLFVALLLLNTWDVTLFAWPVFVPAMLAVAFWAGQGRPGPGRAGQGQARPG